MADPQRKAPKSRVLAYIREFYPNGPRKLVELTGVKSVSTSLNTGGVGSATVTLSNFKGSNIRYLSYNTLLHSATAEQSATINLEGAQFMDTLSKPGSGFESLWNDSVINRADTSIFKPNDYGYTMGRLNGVKVADTIYQEAIAQSMPVVDKFDLIFIDYKGQDGFWYAGFSGLVSRVGDNNMKTGDQSLTLQCKDYTALFDNASLVTSFNMLSVAEEKNLKLRAFLYSTDEQLAASKSAYENIFSSYSTVDEVILEIVKRAQDMWRLDVMKDDAIGVKGLLFDTTRTYEYNGISNRRGSIAELDGSVEDMTPNLFTSDYDLEKKHYMFDASLTPRTMETTARGFDRPQSGVGDKKILIDPLIKKLDQVFLHKMLINSFTLFNNSKKSADEMLNELASKMMAYKYFDAQGNMVFEMPKYNALPNLSEYGGRSSATAMRHKAVKASYSPSTVFEVYKPNKPPYVIGTFDTKESADLADTKWSKSLGFLKVRKKTVQGALTIKEDANGDQIIPDGPVTLTKDDVDYKYSTLWFHGKNYIPSSDDFVSINTAIDEGSLMTQASMTGDFAFLNIDNKVKMSSLSLYGTAVSDFDTLAKLGVRSYQTQNIYNVVWPSREIGSRILSYLASSVLSRINSQADSGTAQVTHRPELQMGRTFIDPYRMKSYLITAISQSWAVGGTLTTTLNLSFGHPITQTLEQPWSAIEAEPELFGGLNSLGKIKVQRDSGAPDNDTPEKSAIEVSDVKDAK